MRSPSALASLISCALSLAACSSGEVRFPLRAPMWEDTDLRPVSVRCHDAPSDKDPRHVSCAPEPWDGTLYWDGMEQMVLRPLSEAAGLVVGGEARNVNALDEVPDSAWFTNRLGVRPIGADELRLNACPPAALLDADAPEGSWVITDGKTSGSTPGFVIKVPGKGKYLLKVEAHGPERQVAATVIGEATYWATGYYASCEQGLWVKPSIFKLTPGLRARRGNFGDLYDFDQGAVDDLLAHSTMRGGRLRVSASAWVPGYVLQQAKFEGVRPDDPNDVIPHEDRRELRGARLLAAWIGNVDCREGNSLDTWVTDAPGAPPDASPGHVLHYQLGTSASLGNVWEESELSQRFGYSYILDWGQIGAQFATLGASTLPYERVRKAPGHEIFGYWNVADFDPERWKNEYPHPAFDRMTERDGAWMARVLARFTPDMVHTLAELADLRDPPNTEYLEHVLDGRLRKILERYLTRLSPIADVHVEGGDRLCGIDLAEWRALRDPSRFLYSAARVAGPPLAVERLAGARVCVRLSHVAVDGGSPDGAAARYVRVRIEDGVARGPLVAHLYDLGPARGFALAGLERPER